MVDGIAMVIHMTRREGRRFVEEAVYVKGYDAAGRIFPEDHEALVKVLCEFSPWKRRHFTRFDQVEQLVSASEASADTGFMARLLALCSLPRTSPGRRIQYKRINGPYTLIMTAVGQTGLPFGNIPRLLLAWVCTEAVRTQSRELVLGSSLSECMRKLGLAPVGGGRRGKRTRLLGQYQLPGSQSYRVLVERAPAGRAGGMEQSDRTGRKVLP